jgi:hypothetical protein
MCFTLHASSAGLATLHLLILYDSAPIDSSLTDWKIDGLASGKEHYTRSWVTAAFYGKYDKSAHFRAWEHREAQLRWVCNQVAQSITDLDLDDDYVLYRCPRYCGHEVSVGVYFLPDHDEGDRRHPNSKFRVGDRSEYYIYKKVEHYSARCPSCGRLELGPIGFDYSCVLTFWERSGSQTLYTFHGHVAFVNDRRLCGFYRDWSFPLRPPEGLFDNGMNEGFRWQDSSASAK